MRLVNMAVKVSCIIAALGFALIPINAIAGDTFKIEIEREEERSWHRYNFPSKDYNIQATTNDIEVRVCNGEISKPDCNTYTIGTSPRVINLGGVVHIILPEGEGKVRISIWE